MTALLPLLVHAALCLQAPADGAFIKPAEPGATPASPAAPAARPQAPSGPMPAPDRDDAKDNPAPVLVGPGVEGSIMSLEQDAPGLAGLALSAALPMTACWALPGAAVAGGAGLLGVLLSAAVVFAWPAAVFFPMLAAPCMLPGCLLVGGASATLGTLVAQFFSGRRGPLLQPVGAAVLAWLPLGLLVMVPPLVMSGAVFVASLVAFPTLLLRSRGEVVGAQQEALSNGFLVAAVAHPLLSALWIGAAGMVGSLIAGGVAATVFRSMGRHLEPGEDASVDVLDVEPPPAFQPGANGRR